MEVILKLGTKNNPGSRVVIKADVYFENVAAFDNWLKAQKIARDWLNAQKVAEE